MIQWNLVKKAVFTLLLLGIAFSEGRPSKSVGEDEDRVVETTTTTTVTKSWPMDEDDSPFLLRAENLVGVVFGATAILIANLMLLMLYIRKRRRQRREAGDDPKDKKGDQKTGWWWSKGEPKEETSEVKENRPSGFARLFLNSSKSKDPETGLDAETSEETASGSKKEKSGNPDDVENSEGNQKSQRGFLGGLFGASSKVPQENTEETTEKSQDAAGASKVEKKSFFVKMVNRSKKSGKESGESGDNDDTLEEDALKEEATRTKTSFFTTLKKKRSLKIITDLEDSEAAEKKDSPFNRLSKKLLSPGKLKAPKDLKGKSKSTENIDETAEDVGVETKIERTETTTQRKFSRTLFSPEKKKASKDLRRNSETKGQEKVQSPRKFKSVLQKFQQAADSNKTVETREASTSKEEKKGE